MWWGKRKTGSKVTEERMEENEEFHYSHSAGECVGYEVEIAEVRHILNSSHRQNSESLLDMMHE